MVIKMYQFIAKVKSYDGDTGTNITENLLLSAESFEEAIRHIEGWYEDDLMSLSLEMMTNKSWVVISENMAKTIVAMPENQEFW